jgi:hypothetical protein
LPCISASFPAFSSSKEISGIQVYKFNACSHCLPCVHEAQPKLQGLCSENKIQKNDESGQLGIFKDLLIKVFEFLECFSDRYCTFSFSAQVK